MVSSQPEMTFAARVVAVVAATRAGDVVTYGEVALEAGVPGGARAAGRVLATGDEVALPWWRVVAADGRLAPGKEQDQAARLAAEGVDCTGGRVRRPPVEGG